jgi:hypothetical protein
VELLLNLAGGLVAIALICLWLCFAPPTSGVGSNRKAQVVALILLILVIFPVISVTDDLLAAASPAETDVLSRRNHEFSGLLAVISMSIRPGESVPPQPAAAACRLIASLELQDRVPDAPALAPIENRPPPTA